MMAYLKHFALAYTTALPGFAEQICYTFYCSITNCKLESLLCNIYIITYRIAE